MTHANRIAELYDTHAETLRRYIFRRVGDFGLAEDLCNEVFVRMLESLDTYQERGLPIEAWMYRIARDRIIDTYRWQNRHPSTPLSNIEICAPTVHHVESDEMFRTMLENLNDDQRRVLLMRYRDDLTFAEIATALDRSEGAVKQLKRRGLQQIKERYRPTNSA
ncbi:MAG: RNA polymerase sigma factor [Roseiflexaceae bacterium]